jgi:hypothetical protein
MTRRKALERWGKNSGELRGHISSSVAYCEIAYEKTPTSVHGLFGIVYHPNEKANVIEGCSENQYTSHDLCDKNHERQLETRVMALLASVDDIP